MLNGWTKRERWLAIGLLAVIAAAVTAGAITENMEFANVTVSGILRLNNPSGYARLDGPLQAYGTVDFGNDATDVATFHHAVVLEDSMNVQGNITMNEGTKLRGTLVTDHIYLTPAATSAKPDSTGLETGYTYVTPDQDTTWTWKRATGVWVY